MSRHELDAAACGSARQCGALVVVGLVIYLLVVGSALTKWTVIWCVWAAIIGVTIRRRLRRDKDEDEALLVWFVSVWLLLPTATC
jgi:hypothetical protein